MSNVIMGIIAIALMIGLALVGASYFGEEATGASQDAKATSYMSPLTLTASAVKVYNRDASPPAPATTSLAFLSDLGVGPTTLPNGNSVVLVGATGALSGQARYAAVSLGSGSADGGRVCKSMIGMMSISEVPVVPVLSSWPSTGQRGCFLASAAIGPFASGDYIMYVGI